MFFVKNNDNTSNQNNDKSCNIVLAYHFLILSIGSSGGCYNSILVLYIIMSHEESMRMLLFIMIISKLQLPVLSSHVNTYLE